MGKVKQFYLETFIKRFDPDGIISYFSEKDLFGLHKEDYVFTNSINQEIHAFLFFYDGFKIDKLVLFCPGLGPGHIQYIREIELLAKRGYLVLTLDYLGCNESSGDNMLSVNEPTRDVCDLLNEVKLNKISRINELSDYEIIIIGHSLGAYTALNVININKDIKKGIIISGFLNIIKEFMGLSKVPFPFFFNSIKKYEESVNKEYNHLNNIKYLKQTTDNILFIHAKNDTLVPFNSSTGYIIKHIKNNNLEFMLFDDRKHNPNYQKASLDYMNEVFVKYNQMERNGEFKSNDDRINYMKSKDIYKMTEQDQDVWDKIEEIITK